MAMLLAASAVATEGDPLPGVDVSLEQDPGGVADRGLSHNPDVRARLTDNDARTRSHLEGVGAQVNQNRPPVAQEPGPSQPPPQDPTGTPTPTPTVTPAGPTTTPTATPAP